MKIRKFFEIEDGVYVCRIKTEDWSENDSNLILRFGEPEIDVGGEIVLFDEETGTHTGLDGATILEDTTKVWTVNAYIGRIIRRESDSVVSAVTANTLNTISTAASLAWALAAEYTILKASFTLPTDYRRIKTESPFICKFDSRDYTPTSITNYTVPESLRPTAKLMALTWADIMEDRIISAITTLRTNEDTYTGEKVTTV